MERRQGAHIPHIGLWTRRWTDHWVCDAWPVRRQTYGYLPSRRASPPLGRYQIILLADRGTWVWTTCPTKSAGKQVIIKLLFKFLCTFWQLQTALEVVKSERGRTDVVKADTRTVIHDLVHDQVHHLIVDVTETVMWRWWWRLSWLMLLRLTPQSSPADTSIPLHNHSFS